MVKREFLTVFQNDGSLHLSDIDKAILPINASTTFGMDIHSKKALVAVYVLRNGMFADFPSVEQMKQIIDAINAKLDLQL